MGKTTTDGGRDTASGQVREARRLLVVGAVVVCGSAVAILRPSLRFLREGRPPTEAERLSTLQMRRVAPFLPISTAPTTSRLTHLQRSGLSTKQPPKTTSLLLYSFAFVSPSAACSLNSFLWIFPDYSHISTSHPQIKRFESKLTGFFGTASIKCTPPSNRLCFDTRSASHALIASASSGLALSGV